MCMCMYCHGGDACEPLGRGSSQCDRSRAAASLTTAPRCACTRCERTRRSSTISSRVPSIWATAPTWLERWCRPLPAPSPPPLARPPPLPRRRRRRTARGSRAARWSSTTFTLPTRRERRSPCSNRLPCASRLASASPLSEARARARARSSRLRCASTHHASVCTHACV